MDDLISRKAAIEFANEQKVKETGAYSKGRNDALNIMRSALNNPDAIPSVPAVPLDKLRELCEETDARVPCVLCDKIMPGWCKQNNNFQLNWDVELKCPTWKQLLTEWMKEQNA